MKCAYLFAAASVLLAGCGGTAVAVGASAGGPTASLLTTYEPPSPLPSPTWQTQRTDLCANYALPYLQGQLRNRPGDLSVVAGTRPHQIGGWVTDYHGWQDFVATLGGGLPKPAAATETTPYLVCTYEGQFMAIKQGGSSYLVSRVFVVVSPAQPTTASGIGDARNVPAYGPPAPRQPVDLRQLATVPGVGGGASATGSATTTAQPLTSGSATTPTSASPGLTSAPSPSPSSAPSPSAGSGAPAS